MTDLDRLARALHATGLNEIGRAAGSHGKFTAQCICNADALTLIAALASEPQPPDDEWVKEQLRRHPKRPPVGLASEPQP